MKLVHEDDTNGNSAEMWTMFHNNEEAIYSFVNDLMGGIEAYAGRDVAAAYIDKMFHTSWINDEYRSAALDGLFNRLCQYALD